MYLHDQKSIAIKKWLHALLQENSNPAYSDIIDRVSTALITEKDLEDFGKLLGTIYYAGFSKAFNDYKKEMTKYGIKLKVMSEEEIK